MATESLSKRFAASDVQLVAKLFRGFAEPVRLAIVVELAADELRVTDLVRRVGSSQANVSGHLACLKECGLVVDRPEGREVFYSIAAPEVVRVVRAAEALLAVTGHSVDLCPSYRAPRTRRP